MAFFLPLDDPNKYDNDNGLPPGLGGLRPCCPDAVGHLVLDVPGPVFKVGRLDIVVLNGVFIGGLAGRHHIFLWQRRQRRRQWGEGG